MKCTILENLSTTTKIESLPFFDLGKPKTKSNEISTQGSVGTSNDAYSPYSCTLDFAFLLAIHLFTNSLHISFHLWAIEMLMQYIQGFHNPKVTH
jgi:hypothetical protein